MTLKHLRTQWEQGREVLLALATPNREKVFVLLSNPHGKGDYRAEYSIFEYSQEQENNWNIWISPEVSEFEHVEQGLEYLSKKFEKFLP